MIIVSNYLLDKTDMHFPDHIVARVNVAWLNTLDELRNILSKTRHDIYLDYPQGRTKPPKPKITLTDTIAMAHQFPRVKYFAVSNVEDPENIFKIKQKLPSHIEIVPKIETEKGINNLENIVKKIQNKYIMFDKEDLYIDINRDAEKFENLINVVKEKGKKIGIQILDLHGVVFLPYKN